MMDDVVIVGAGAAGLMTAIQAAQGGLRVLLLEGRSKPGAKILMSGGTRCNVTNRAVSEKDFNSEHIRDVRNILRSFSNADTIRFFKGIGVDLVLEPTGKYFPSTNSGKTILEALLRRVYSLKATFLVDHKVNALCKKQEGFMVHGDGFQYPGKKVVLTTGGLSYPATGSDGTGYRLAQSFGHSIVETTPALTPLTTRSQDLKSLSGITLDTRLTLVVDGRREIACEGSFLFTHFGFSGPVALDISRHYLRAKGQKQITANFIPTHDEHSLQTHLTQIQKDIPRMAVKNVLVAVMPQRLAELILKNAGIEGSQATGQLSKALRKTLVDQCLHYPLDVTGALGYSKAEVTAGGIDWAEVNPKTLESKLAPGLFFAGEMLDVDGRIGGFNFQWAWASGYVAAQSIIKEFTDGQKNH